MLNRIIKSTALSSSHDIQIRQQRILQLRKALKRSETAVWSTTNKSKVKPK